MPHFKLLRHDGLTTYQCDWTMEWNMLLYGTSHGLQHAMTESVKLAAIIGSAAIPHTEVTKKVREYNKANSLQDAANEHNFNADAKRTPSLAKIRPRCLK